MVIASLVLLLASAASTRGLDDLTDETEIFKSCLVSRVPGPLGSVKVETQRGVTAVKGDMRGDIELADCLQGVPRRTSSLTSASANTVRALRLYSVMK